MSLWRRVYAERRAVILPILVAVVASVGVLAAGVLPLVRSVSALQQESADAAFRLNSAKLADTQAKAAQASKTRADQELTTFYTNVLPADFPSARRLMLAFLEQTARASGLTFERGQSAQPTDLKDSQLERVTAKVTLVGDYQNIRKFLYAVETAPEFVIVERVGLAQAADLKATATGTLEVTLDVATYYLRSAGGRAMKVLPPPGPQRTRQLVLLTLFAGVAAVLAWRALAQAPAAPTLPPPVASNAQGGGTNARAAGGDPGLAAAGGAREARAQDGAARFGAQPVPVRRAASAAANAAARVRAAASPAAAASAARRRRSNRSPCGSSGAWSRPTRRVVAVLADSKDTVLRGLEGQILDGRYRIVKIGEESLVIEYVNGTGRTTLPLR